MSDNDARVSSPPKNAEADAAKDDDEHIPFAALNWNTAPGQQSKKDDDTMEILLDDEPSVEDDGPFEDQRGKPLNIQDLTAPLTEPMSSPAQSVPPQVLQPIPTAQVTDEDEYDSDVTPISGRKKRFPVVIAAGIVALVGGIGAAVFMFSTDSADDKEAPMKQASMLPMEGDVNIKPFNNTQENPPSPSPLEAKAAASPAPTPTPNAEPADEEAKSTESPGPEKSDEQEAATPAASASPAPAKPTAGGKKAPTRSTRSTVSSRSSSKPVVEKAPEKSDDAPKKKATTLSSILNGTDDSMKKMPISRSREAVQKAMRKVAKFAKRCSRTEKRLVTVSLTINTKGRVTRAAPMGDFKGTEVGRCVALAAKSAVFPPALKPMTLQYPLHP